MSYQLLWHLILPLLHVFSASWCFAALLDNHSVLLCVSSQVELVPSWVAQRSAWCSYSIHCGAGACLSVGISVGKLQWRPSSCPRSQHSAGRCLAAASQRSPPLLLLPHCCIFYTRLQQPFSQPFRQPFLCPVTPSPFSLPPPCTLFWRGEIHHTPAAVAARQATQIWSPTNQRHQWHARTVPLGKQISVPSTLKSTSSHVVWRSEGSTETLLRPFNT